MGRMTSSHLHAALTEDEKKHLMDESVADTTFVLEPLPRKPARLFTAVRLTMQQRMMRRTLMLRIALCA